MYNPSPNKLSRRSVVKFIGTVGVGAGLVGDASADQGSGVERRVVGTESKRAAELVKRRADQVVRELDFGDIGYTVVGDFATDVEVDIEQRTDVRYVEPESEVKLLQSSQDVPWGVEEIGATELHNEGMQGAGAHVAIIDSGIDSDHPDLQSNLGEGNAVVSCDDCRRDWGDDHNHGTHVAGIADAASNDRGVVGVSTKAILHPVKAISADGSGDASTLAEGIKWVADQGYDVANMSLGSTSPSDVMHDAVKYADEKGVLVVAAAGNEEPDEKTVHYPGAFPEALCVGAIDEDGDMAEFSLTGEDVDIVAPGVDIRSCVRDGYEVYSGTSMATPHVSGAAALLFGEGYSKEEVRTRLLETAIDLGHDEDEQGRGLVNPAGALGKGGGGGGGSDEYGVSTLGATGVEKQAATLNGELTGLGEQSSARVGFVYWAEGKKQSTRQVAGLGRRSSAGQFSTTVEGLQGETSYRFHAVAVAGGERLTGDEQTFTTVGETGGNEEPSVVVETNKVSDIEEDEAELNGRVTEMDGVEELKAYFEYWVKGRKDETYVRFPVDVLDDPDDFDDEAENLWSDTEYVAVAQCVASDGTAFTGDPVEFRTIPSED